MTKLNKLATKRAPLRFGVLRNERGSGLLSATFSLALFLVLVGVALNVVVGLWIRSSVDAVAHDAAVLVASQPPSVDAERLALNQARELLGSYSKEVTFEFVHAVDSSQVILHVQSPGYAVMPRVVGERALVPGLDRRIIVHREFAS